MKRTANITLICGILFGVLATWLGPKMISYYYAPPVTNSLSSACNESISWAMNKLVLTQLIGTGLGFVIGLVLAFAFRSKTPPAVPATVPAASGPVSK